MKTKITNLREHLFLTLENLLDEENPMDINRAKAVAEVGKVIIESAKTEVEMAKVLILSKGDGEKAIELKPAFFNEPKRIG